MSACKVITFTNIYQNTTQCLLLAAAYEYMLMNICEINKDAECYLNISPYNLFTRINESDHRALSIRPQTTSTDINGKGLIRKYLHDNNSLCLVYKPLWCAKFLKRNVETYLHFHYAIIRCLMVAFYFIYLYGGSKDHECNYVLTIHNPNKLVGLC